MNEMQLLEGLTLARIIKNTGERVAEQLALQVGNLAFAALIVRSALAELEFNIRVTGSEQALADYEKVKGALEERLGRALVKSLGEKEGLKVTGTGGEA